MNEKTLKPLLQEFAKRAREVTEQIKKCSRPPDLRRPHAPLSSADLNKRPPHELDMIEGQLRDVVKSIEAYLLILPKS